MLFHSCVLRPVWLILMYIILNKNVVNSVTPLEPIRCSSGNKDCVITNSYGSFPDRSTCHAANVVYPKNEDQLISYVRDATINKRKIKVATRYGHSFTKLVCPDGKEGLLISTKKLNKVIRVNKKKKTITVQSGMLLKTFIDKAAKVNLALPNSPYWAGVTIGGMLGTGAHGSSLWGRGSAVHDYVVGLKIVSPGNHQENYVKVRTLNVHHHDLDAAKVSLGVLGVISQVTFKLEPLFKRNITYITREDKNLEKKAPIFGVQHEFADMLWLPGQRKVVYRVDDRVPITTPGNGSYDFLGMQSTPQAILEFLRKTEVFEESNGCDKLRCVSSNEILPAFIENAFGLTNDGVSFSGYPVVGYQNNMQTSGGCLNTLNNNGTYYCGWDPRIKGQFYYSNGFTLPMSKATKFIKDIKKLQTLKPTSLCGLDQYMGILMRYVKASSAYLGKDKDGIDFDITYYRSRDYLGPRLFEDIMDEIEQMAIFKYGALPHWGKNRNIAFQSVIHKYKDGYQFLRVKEKYDPMGLFSNDWTDQVLGLKKGVSLNKKGCAREGLCKCNRDKDCGSGYKCGVGLVYKEARVCKKRREVTRSNCTIDILKDLTTIG